MLLNYIFESLFESLFLSLSVFDAPLSSFVGSVLDVSAFKLTGSPNAVGFDSANSFNDFFCPAFPSPFRSVGFSSVSPSVGVGALFALKSSLEGAMFEDCGG